MPKTRDPNAATANISTRLFGGEAERWEEIWRRAVNRDSHIDKKDVIKFLLGLPSKADKILTKDDRLYFQGRGQGIFAHIPTVKVNQDESDGGAVPLFKASGRRSTGRRAKR